MENKKIITIVTVAFFVLQIFQSCKNESPQLEQIHNCKENEYLKEIETLKSENTQLKKENKYYKAGIIELKSRLNPAYTDSIAEMR